MLLAWALVKRSSSQSSHCFAVLRLILTSLNTVVFLLRSNLPPFSNHARCARRFVSTTHNKKERSSKRKRSFLAGVLGIGPRLEVLETPVIPFHHTPIWQEGWIKSIPLPYFVSLKVTCFRVIGSKRLISSFSPASFTLLRSDWKRKVVSFDAIQTHVRLPFLAMIGT